MKKIICMILIISILSALVFTANVFAKGETVKVDGITYTSYDTYCELTSCDYDKSGEVDIPLSVKFRGKPLPVTSIGEDAFYNCSGLTSVTIGNGVTSIGDWAFYGCSGLTSVTIGNGVTSIGDGAFSYCSGLETVYYKGSEEQWNKINIDENKNNVLFEAEIIFGKSATVTIDGITYTSNVGFCTLTKCDTNKSGKVTIPSSVNFDGNELPVKSIENQSFWFCKKITEVTIPDSVEYIANSAFFDCDSLENVTIGKNVSKIGVAAFVDCDSLASITVSKDNPVYRSSGNCLIETISKTLIVGCKNSVIPGDGSVTSIFKEAFESCIGLTSIIIPKSVTSIGRFAFFGCDNLKTVYYTGSEAEWNKISVDDYNDPLLNAEILFNYVSEKGDINGDGAIDNKDVVVLFRYVSGGNKVTDESIYDINGDGEVDNKDVVTLFRFVSMTK